MNAEGVCEPGKNELCEIMHGLAEYDGNQVRVSRREVDRHHKVTGLYLQARKPCSEGRGRNDVRSRQ